MPRYYQVEYSAIIDGVRTLSLSHPTPVLRNARVCRLLARCAVLPGHYQHCYGDTPVAAYLPTRLRLVRNARY
eukprot:3824982-Rhodomonas_salina.6